MIPEEFAPEAASSVVIKGFSARTYGEIEAVVRDLEARHVERLLSDLPHLMALSSTKTSLVSYVVLSTFRAADAETRVAIQEKVATVVESLPRGEARDRVAVVLQRLR